jgi:transposase-like protein
VYALAVNKRKDTYERISEEVQNLAGDPDDVMIDYERAAMNAIQTTFPNADVKGCFFHLAQNVYRKVCIIQQSKL